MFVINIETNIVKKMKREVTEGEFSKTYLANRLYLEL